MEMHFTIPEVKALIKAMERELNKAEEFKLDSIEVLDLQDLKARFERKLREREYQLQHEDL